MTAAWQPIETAPKDGTRVLAVTNEYDGVLIVSWRKAWFGNKVGEMAWFDDEDYDTYINITHWMPLPAPPEAAE